MAAEVHRRPVPFAAWARVREEQRSGETGERGLKDFDCFCIKVYLSYDLRDKVGQRVVKVEFRLSSREGCNRGLTDFEPQF